MLYANEFYVNLLCKVRELNSLDLVENLLGIIKEYLRDRVITKQEHDYVVLQLCYRIQVLEAQYGY